VTAILSSPFPPLMPNKVDSEPICLGQKEQCFQEAYLGILIYLLAPRKKNPILDFQTPTTKHIF